MSRIFVRSPPMAVYKRGNISIPWKELCLTAALIGFAFFIISGSFRPSDSLAQSGSKALSQTGSSTSVAVQCGKSDIDLMVDVEKFALRGPLPWSSLETSVQQSFLMDGKAKLQKMMFDHEQKYSSKSKSETFQAEWKNEHIQGLADNVRKANSTATDPVCMHGKSCDESFFAAFQRYPIKGKDVLIVGSQYPWAEAFCLAHEAKSIVTVDANPPKLNGTSLLKVVHAKDICSSQKFDAIVSFSNLEHDGLGRYGDYINPNADLERMQKLKKFLRPRGLLYLGVPIGIDKLVFNAHRIYGRVRFSMLTAGWKLLESFGPVDWSFSSYGRVQKYPLHVLTL